VLIARKVAQVAPDGAEPDYPDEEVNFACLEPFVTQLEPSMHIDPLSPQPATTIGRSRCRRNHGATPAVGLASPPSGVEAIVTESRAVGSGLTSTESLEARAASHVFTAVIAPDEREKV
jgi:hypothetical protein